MRIDKLVKETCRDIMKLYMGLMMTHDTHIDEDIIQPFVDKYMELIANVLVALFRQLKEDYNEGFISKCDIIEYYQYIQDRNTRYINDVALTYEEIRGKALISLDDYIQQCMMLIDVCLDKSDYEVLFDL